MNPTKTTHGKVRQANRGVSDEALQAALDYGDEHPQNFSRTAYYISDKAVKRAKKEGRDISEFRKLCVVMSYDGAVITTYKTDAIRVHHTKGNYQRKKRQSRARRR